MHDGAAPDLDVAAAASAGTAARPPAVRRRGRTSALQADARPTSSSRTATSSRVDPRAAAAVLRTPGARLAGTPAPTRRRPAHRRRDRRRAARRHPHPHREGGLTCCSASCGATCAVPAGRSPSSCCCSSSARSPSLYLPSLNADIIDNGVATGDTGYILRDRRRDARGHAGADRLRDRRRLLRRPDRDGASAATSARGALPPGRRRSPRREVGQFGAPSLITRTTNDVQQVQMLVLMTCTMLVAAPIMCVGGIFMALREDVGLSWLLLVVRAGAGRRDRPRSSRRMVPQFRLMQDAHRRGQPGAARADHRHPGGPRLRPRAATRPSASPTPTTSSPTSRCGPAG